MGMAFCFIQDMDWPVSEPFSVESSSRFIHSDANAKELNQTPSLG